MIDKTDPTNRDTVPAMLTPGEFVLNKEASQMYGPTIQKMNDAGLQKRAIKNIGLQGIPPRELNLGGETSGRGRISTEQSQAIPWIQNLENREGFRDYVYIDSEGHATIGTGHKLPASFKKYAWDGKSESTKHKPYTKAELDQMLKNDLSTARSAAEKNFSNWNELPVPVQDGLTNMAFQLGGAGQSKFKKMREAVEAGDYTKAAFEADDSDWSEQTNVRSEDLVNVFLAQNPVQSNFDVPRPGQGYGVEAFGTGNSLNNPRPPSNQSAELIVNPLQDSPYQGGPVSPIQTTFLPSSLANDPLSVPEQSLAPPNPRDYGRDFQPMAPNNYGRDFQPMAPNNYGRDFQPMAPNNYGAAPNTAAPNPDAPNPAPLPREQSFGEAFSAGRAAHGGGGGVFSYQGKDYSTDLKEESLTTANSGGSIQHLNFGDWVKNALGMNSPEVDDEALLNNSSQSIDEMARQSLQEDVNNSWFKRDARDKLTKFDQGMLPPPMYSEPAKRQELVNNMESATFKKDERKALTDHDMRVSKIDEEVRNPVPISYNESDRGVPYQNAPPDLSSYSSPFEQMTQLELERYIQSSLPTAPGNLTAQEVYTRRFKLNNIDPDLPDINPQLPNGDRDFRDLPVDYFSTQLDNQLTERQLNMRRRMDERGGPRTEEDIRILSEIDQFKVDQNINKSEAMDLQLAPINSEINQKQSEIDGIQKFLNDNPELPIDMRNNMLRAIDDIRTNIQPLVETSNVVGQSLLDQNKITKDLTPPYMAPINAPTLDSRLTIESPPLVDTVKGAEEPRTEAERNAAKKLGNKQMVQTMNQKLDGIIAAEGSNKPNPKVKDLPDVPENSSEIPEAKSALKDFFGDIFDKKELMRAAVMYLGARATGLSGNQALAFAGKQYISRSDAKENTYQKVALAGKHTKKTLALYKKSMNPNDLILKGVSLVNTGVTEERFDVATGQRFTGMKMKDPTTGSIRLMMPDGVTPVNFQTSTTDARYAQGSVENDAYNTRLVKSFATRVTEFQELDKNRTTGETKAERTPHLQITPSSFADQAVSYMLANGVQEQAMTGIMSNIYNEMVTDAKDGKLKNINESAIEGYFQRSWIESKTKNASAFMLADQTTPVPVANVRSFFDTLRNVGQGNGIEIMNDTQFSTWLMKQDAYLEWVDMDPEDQKEYNDRGSKNLPPKDRKSGMMLYLLEGLTD